MHSAIVETTNKAANGEGRHTSLFDVLMFLLANETRHTTHDTRHTTYDIQH
jgi:hypothetical protein